MNALVEADKIEKYAGKTTSPKIPEEAFIVSAFLKSFFVRESYSNSSEPGFIEAFDRIKENVQKFLLLNSYGSNASEFADEPFYSILRYSLNKKDILLFQMIQEAFWHISSKIEIYINVNKALDDVRYTDLEAPEGRSDCEQWDDKLWYCTDTLNLYTDMNNVNPNLDIPSFYVKDVFGSDVTEEEKKKYVTESEYSEVYAKYARFISLVKPARYSILDNPIPLYAFQFVSQKCWGTRNASTSYVSAIYSVNSVSSPYSTLDMSSKSNLDKYSNSGNNYDTVKNLFKYMIPVSFTFAPSSTLRIYNSPVETKDFNIGYRFSKEEKYPGKIIVDIIAKIPSSWVLGPLPTYPGGPTYTRKLGLGFTNQSTLEENQDVLVVFDVDKYTSFNPTNDIGVEKEDGYRYAAFHLELYC